MAIHLVSDNQPNNGLQKSAKHQQPEISPEELQHTLRLAGLLQTSLEADSILDYFLEAAQLVVSFDGARYSYEPLNTQYQFGENKAHSCTYRLAIAQEALGQIEFSRQKRFSDEEIFSLEKLLGQLIYPLRNGIWYQRALQASLRDPLTGAFNRAAMDNTLVREVELAQRNETPLSLIVVDIDLFKSINDNYGHSAGDNVLKTFVTCINTMLRKSDMLFRYGGEEFTILLSGTPEHGAVQVAERVRQAIAFYSFHHEQTSIPVTASVGVSTLNSGDSTKSLFDRADKALYDAKQQGRNKVIFQSS